MVSLAYGIPKTRLGLALSFAAGDQGYYFSVGTGQISGFSLVAGWNFSEPYAGWTTEATIAGGTGFVGGTYSVVNDMTANKINMSSTIGAGWGVGFSKGLTTTMTWNLYPMPAPSPTPNINPNSVFAPDRLRVRR